MAYGGRHRQRATLIIADYFNSHAGDTCERADDPRFGDACGHGRNLTTAVFKNRMKCETKTVRKSPPTPQYTTFDNGSTTGATWRSGRSHSENAHEDDNGSAADCCQQPCSGCDHGARGRHRSPDRL